MGDINNILERLISRYPDLAVCRLDILNAYHILKECYENGNKVLLCGNGGSAADCDHILGELMKGFLKKRRLSIELSERIFSIDSQKGSYLGEKLQHALPAINLCAQSSIITAVANDTDPDLIFAQQVVGYGRDGDVLLGISPLGNAKNVVYAITISRALGLKVIGLTGLPGGKMKDICDVTIKVPRTSILEAQELHLPIYHALCLMLEEYFFEE